MVELLLSTVAAVQHPACLHLMKWKEKLLHRVGQTYPQVVRPLLCHFQMLQLTRGFMLRSQARSQHAIPVRWPEARKTVVCSQRIRGKLFLNNRRLSLKPFSKTVESKLRDGLPRLVQLMLCLVPLRGEISLTSHSLAFNDSCFATLSPLDAARALSTTYALEPKLISSVWSLDGLRSLWVVWLLGSCVKRAVD